MLGPGDLLDACDVGRRQHEVHAAADRPPAEILEQRPALLVRHRHVIHDDPGLVLGDEAVELEFAVTEQLCEGTEHDETRTLQINPKHVDRVLVAIENDDNVTQGRHSWSAMQHSGRRPGSSAATYRSRLARDNAFA